MPQPPSSWDMDNKSVRKIIAGSNVIVDPTSGLGEVTISSTGGSGIPSSTVVAETTFGQSSSAGAASTYSRGDHTHGSPSDSALEKTVNKGAVGGYAGLGTDSLVPTAQLGTGTANSTTFLRGDKTYAVPTASVDVKQTEIDFGATPLTEASFTVSDAGVSSSSQLMGGIAYEAPTDRDLDEVEMEPFNVRFGPGTGAFTVFIQALEGPVEGKYKLNYLIG